MVTIRIKDTGYGAFTDEKGYFTITGAGLTPPLHHHRLYGGHQIRLRYG